MAPDFCHSTVFIILLISHDSVKYTFFIGFVVFSSEFNDFISNLRNVIGVSAIFFDSSILLHFCDLVHRWVVLSVLEVSEEAWDVEEGEAEVADVHEPLEVEEPSESWIFGPHVAKVVKAVQEEPVFEEARPEVNERDTPERPESPEAHHEVPQERDFGVVGQRGPEH